MIRNEGYPAEIHEVTTDDGYVLTLHRIPGQPGSPGVFLQHGLLGSSFDWVLAGKNRSLGNETVFLQEKFNKNELDKYIFLYSFENSTFYMQSNCKVHFSQFREIH